MLPGKSDVFSLHDVTLDHASSLRSGLCSLEPRLDDAKLMRVPSADRRAAREARQRSRRDALQCRTRRTSGWRQADTAGSRIGGARRDRTDDLMLAKHALSQLSYGPSRGQRNRRPRSEPPRLAPFRSPIPDIRPLSLVGLGRLELPTSRLSSARSNQLSYKPEHEIPPRAPASDGNGPGDNELVREEKETKAAKSRQKPP